jgi:putative transposase
MERRHRKSIDILGHAHSLTFSCYHGLALLGKERTCQWLADAIDEARTELSFELWAYVFMPNHAHLIVIPRTEQATVASMLRRIKHPVSRQAIAYLKGVDPDWIDRLTSQRGNRTETHFWQRGGGYDRNLTEPATLERAIAYLHLNPVRKGLIERAAEWKWSSAGWFEGQQLNSLRPDPVPSEWTVGMSKS